ncbi:mastermind-like protein 1 [Chiloscyllium plagiosum]|uniref:mastermind-like protein 1 n=1 Tax=Chiloscyllium plagiosum TaxID=36176 RepID=UPI001CB7CB88|nr:mastermind-like protein 1 [Chiloscyllium plagiosum]
MAEFVLPRHSAVVERLRKRIELCRRHHTACEARYQRASAERLDLERQHSLALHQRCLQAKSKRAGKQRPPQPQPPPPPPPPPPSAAQQDSQVGFRSSNPGAATSNVDSPPGAASGDQSRTSTLQALHERVKKKLMVDGSSLNGDQQNGFEDGSFSGPKKLRLNGEDGSGLLAVNASSNGMLPMSPLHQRDKRTGIGDSAQSNGNHSLSLDNVKKESIPDSSVQVNGNCDGADGFTLIKELKQESVLDLHGMNPVGTSLSQNNMFPDINLNEQEWQELFDELNRSVPDQDIQDLFNEDFEDKKDIEPAGSSDQTTLQDSITIKTEISSSSYEREQKGPPQIRPSASGPSFSSVSVAPVNTAPSGTGISQAMAQTSRSTQLSVRSDSSVLLPGKAGPSVERSPAQQLQQMAAKQKQRAQLLQKQQMQHSSSNQVPNWSTAPTQSPLGGPYSLDKPNSPSLYPQDFNQKLPMTSVQPKSSPKAGGNYLQANHVPMLSHQPNTLGQNSTNSQAPLLSYANTKRLTHFEMDNNPRAVLPNHNKAAMFSYVRHPQTLSHLSDEQKRMLLKQKELPQGGVTYRPLLQHNQDQNPGTVTRASNSVQASGPGTQPPPASIASNHGNAVYIGSQQQAAVMKQQILMDQQKQREQQLQLIEQQKQQYLQRQQLLAEQEKQRKQQEQQLQRHLTRPPPQYQDQQQNQYRVEQVSQFQSPPQVLQTVGNLAAANASSSRLFPQNQNMIQIGQSQSSVSSSSSAAGQSELGASQYSNMHNVQQGIYNVGSNVNQMLPHSAQGTIGNGQHSNPLQMQANMTPGAQMVTGYSQNHLNSSNLAQQQHNKGTVNQAVSKTHLQRLPGAVVSQNPTWPNQSLQSMNNQNQTNSNLVAFSSTSTFHVRPSRPKFASQQFVQGMSRPGLSSVRSVGSINSTVGDQVMPTLGGPLSRTNQPLQQSIPSLNQSIPDMTNFASSQQMASRGNLQCNQVYQVRGTSQELPFNYGNQSGGSAVQALPGDTDLMDSLLKNRTTEEWIIDLDELLGSHH